MKHIGRKLYHLFGGLGLLSLYYLLGRKNALTGYGILLVLVLLFEAARLRFPAVNRLIFDRFGGLIRESERNRLTGTAAYVLGIALALLFYRTEIATAAVCFLAFGDVAATAVGERFGRTKLAGDKSLQGTLAFFFAAVIAGSLLPLAGVPLMHGLVLAGALVAATVEVLPLPVNDNLLIPTVSGAVMELIARLTGCA